MAGNKLRAAQLSVFEKLFLLFRLVFLIPALFIFNLLRILFIAWRRGLTLRRYVPCATARIMLHHFSPRELQHIMPSTLSVYHTWIARKQQKAKRCKDKYVLERLRDDVEMLKEDDDGAAIMWLGNRQKAKHFVLFFHGGGYIAPMLPGHLEWCLQAYVKNGKKTKTETAVAMLRYTLCPQGQYPTQLRQAAAALRHLLKSGTRPEKIIIGGDSAGGNLTVQLLGHLVRPHPAVQPIQLNRCLRGAFAISPWLGSNFATSAFRRNQNIDMLSPSVCTYCRGQLLNNVGYGEEEAAGKGWALPLDVQESWFDGFGNIVKTLYVTAGEQEVLMDQGVSFAEAVQRRNRGMDVRLEVMRDEAHDFILVEGNARTLGDATKRMKAWVEEVMT